MKNKFFTLSLIGGIATFVACNNGSKINTATTPDALASNIDSTVKPQDDFFTYANGKWFKEHPIPASEKQNGLWKMIGDTINAQVFSLCKKCAADTKAEAGSPRQKIGDFYYSAMDSVTLNKNGIADIKPELDKIDAIKDSKDFAAIGAYMQLVSGSPFFVAQVQQDDKISSKNAIYIRQGGLSLPDRSYYIDKDERTEGVRKGFLTYAKNMFVIMGYDAAKAEKAADNVMKIETELAMASRKREDTRDPVKNYNKMSFTKSCTLAPDFNWKDFFAGVGIAQVDTVVVTQPEFMTAMNKCIKSCSVDEWKDYLKLHYITGLAQYLDDKTFAAYFDFYGKILSGVKEPQPRWKRAVEQTNASLGELIGQVYITDYLPKGFKEKLLEIGNAIRTAYADRIQKLDWMSAATKQKAEDKLSKIMMKVGNPDKWKDMSKLEVSRQSYVKNIISANMWFANYIISEYGKPVDRTQWDMEPQTYNAYYNPANNEIVVPGCNIIIPGYEHKLADDALLYAIIGTTFGHEMTHGFDDQGSQYDANGNLQNWWTAEDNAKFRVKTAMVVKQFNSYVAVDTLHINGSNTQGENIADLGGLMIAYDAYKKTDQFKNNVMIAGLNPNQRFFLGYAYSWMINTRPEALALQVRSNEHAPAKWRVIGPLSNMPEFLKEYNVKPGDKMYRSDSVRVSIW